MKPFEPFSADIDDEGRVYIYIKVFRHDRAKSATIRFKYDSGSDTTTISWEDLGALGYLPDDIKAKSYPYGSASTAGGEKYETFALDLGINNIMGQVIPVDLKFPFSCLIKKEVKKPEHCKKDCEITGDIYRSFRSSLLGNDILSAFDVVSDRQNGKITFTKIADLSSRNSKYKGREFLELESSDIDNTSNSQDLRDNEVYWIEDSLAYHTRDNCPRLLRSRKTVKHDKLSECPKELICLRCQKA